MRDRAKNRSMGAALFGATGWLFADLLLALAMIFLLAEPSHQAIAQVGYSTPVPTCIPRPVPQPALDKADVDFTMPINAGGIESGDSASINGAKAYIRSYLTSHHLENRRAGLVLLFGGAQGVSPGSGNVLATQFYNKVIVSLGDSQFVFYPVAKVAHKEYHDLSNPPSQMEVDMFLFAVNPVVKQTGCVAPTPLPTSEADVTRFM